MRALGRSLLVHGRYMDCEKRDYMEVEDVERGALSGPGHAGAPFNRVFEVYRWGVDRGGGGAIEVRARLLPVRFLLRVHAR